MQSRSERFLGHSSEERHGGLWAPDVKWALVCLILSLLFVLVSAQVPA